jgi:hypothetical protein
MEKDKRLEKLWREFPTLKEGEKDYILGISQALLCVTSIWRKTPDAQKRDKNFDQPSKNFLPT